ncbi:MAG: hypothetical protein EBY52_04780 [Actinobacteria bacterium]|nr:hypothetical protein [Actinomycetota bacterium]
MDTWTDPSRIGSDALRVGLGTLAERGLTFEAWCYSNQLSELARLADDAPMTTMVLDHMGTPVGLAGPHGGQGETEAERARILDDWHAGLVAVAEHRNVHCKLSGLHVLFGIETFGVERCMFASNFPMDKVSVDYEVLWDAFLQIIANAGLDAIQQAALLAGNAAAFYRLEER